VLTARQAIGGAEASAGGFAVTDGLKWLLIAVLLAVLLALLVAILAFR
jgi:hypothetical protein